MPRFLTDKLQISGWRQEVERHEQGFVQRDVRGFTAPLTRQASALKVGSALAALVLVAARLLSIFSPAAQAGDAKILATKAGSRFVVVDGVLHPVMNLSSARLILGSNDSVKVVKDSELAKRPQGMLMGIAAAPDDMRARTDDTSRWAVCSQSDATADLSLTEQAKTRTVVLAGDDAIEAGNSVVGGDTALLVSSVDPGGDTTGAQRIWLLYKGFRYELTSSSTAVKSTLGITDQMIAAATPVSANLIDTIPAGNAIGKPSLDGDGTTSAALPAYTVGTVLTTKGPTGDQFWLVEKNGVQHIGPYLAQLMSNSGEPMSAADASTVSAAAQRSDVDLTAYPWSSPHVATDHDTICYDWTRRGQSTATGRFLAQSGAPMPAAARAKAVAMLPPRDLTPQTDWFYTNPGKGWLVYATGEQADSYEAGQLWWISDSGVRYPLGGSETLPIDKVVAALGLSGATPEAVPWSVLRLLPAGPTLSADAARVVHVTIPADVAQGPVPQPKGLN